MDMFWDLLPGVETDVATRLKAYLHYCAEHDVDAGPAGEAERDGLPIRVDNGVAVVPLMGAMVRRAGPFARMFGIVGTDSTRLAIESALADDDVKQILLRIDSPGGSVSGIDQLADVIAFADKPVTAISEGMIASAAYYIASQADRIVVGRTDLVGSIGTRMMLYDLSKAFEKEGVEAVPIDSGEFKSAGAMGTEITEAQRADFQRIVDFYYNDFVDAVSRGRGMTVKAVRAVGDGRMFSPDEAQVAGLIDGVATLRDTLASMRAPARSARSTKAAKARLRL